MLLEGTIANTILIKKCNKLYFKMNELIDRMEETNSVTDSDIWEMEFIREKFRKYYNIAKVTHWIGFNGPRMSNMYENMRASEKNCLLMRTFKMKNERIIGF